VCCGSGSNISGESGFGSGSNPDPGFWWSKIEEKNTAENFFKSFFLSKIVIYLSLGLRSGYLSYRRSFQLSKENILHFKKRKLINFFSIFMGHFCSSGSGYGSRDPIESRSNSDPDPHGGYSEPLFNKAKRFP
jgi:hypothetical protein